MIPLKAIGSNLWLGEGVPPNSLGVNGEDYQNILNTDYYIKVGGVWIIRDIAQIVINGAINQLLPSQTGNSGKVLGTDGSNPLWVSNGVTALNGLTSNSQTFAVGTSGSDFNINSSGSIHTFNIPDASAVNRGLLTSANFTTFNNKQNALTFGNLTDVGTDGITVTGGTGAVIGTGTSLSQQVSDSTHNGYLSSADWVIFNNKADINSPAFTGIPTAPTASPGTNTTQLATTAFVQSQGFITSAGTMPSAHQSSTTVVTSATTTYVTAISTTITTTAASAKVYAKATGTFTVTGAVPTVLKYRVSINGVAGQEQLLSLVALTTNYTAAVQYISAALGPGTYTVLFEIARNSGTGTVSFFEGTLDAIGLQGSNSNGITQLTGDVTSGPGSGSQVATIANAAVTGAKIANATITAANIANTTITNALIANATINLTTKVTGVLPFANGGTGSTSFPNQRIPFSNGTNFVTSGDFLFDTANTRFTVGTGGGSGTINCTPTSAAGHSTLGLNIYSQTNNHAVQIQNQAAMALELINASAGGGGAGTGVLTRATVSRGTLTARTQALSGDQIWRMSGLAYYDASNTGGETNYIKYNLTENYTVTNQGGEISFGTTPNGTTAAVERLKITNSGESVFSKAIATAQFTTAAKNALTPSAGWVVYDTTLNQLSYYNGTTWVNL